MPVPTTDGLYAMSLDSGLSARVIAGPFDDIDDVLDACFDELRATDRVIAK